MDARHFAEEFVRRKKLADKGIVEKAPPVPPTAAGASGRSSNDAARSGAGWNEVAKKGSGGGAGAGGAADTAGASQMQNASFKVVPGRKKGKK